MSDSRVEISVKLDRHALNNLSSNPTDKVTEFDSKTWKLSLQISNFDLKSIIAAKILKFWI
jgi:hypothetical protein